MSEKEVFVIIQALLRFLTDLLKLELNRIRSAQTIAFAPI